MMDVSIEFAQGSFDRLRRSAQARSRVLNEDMRKTLTKTSLKVLVALRASAKTSPKKRPVQEARQFYFYGEKEKSARMQERIKTWYAQHSPASKTGRHLSGYVSASQRKGGYQFVAVKSRKRGEHVLLPIYGATKKSEANKSPKRIIRKQGLARSSFTWMMGALGGGGSSQQPEIPGVTSVTKGATQSKTSSTLSVKMSNRLNYILSALKGGKRDVSTALDRARAMLMSDTRRALKKAVQK